MTQTDTDRVAAGYDAVYAAIPNSPTFSRLWRTHAMGDDFPEGFEHISFATLAELTWMTTALSLRRGSVLVDLACGMGGPGLWIAREADAALIGVDISAVALVHARSRAAHLELASHARFQQGSFEHSGLDAASADAAISIDALQYAPDKPAALAEMARILRPGGHLGFACFELEPSRLAGVPILGADPTADYRPILADAGFDVLSYDETPGWHDRVTAAYQAVIDQKAPLTAELGIDAYNALSGEVSLTLQLQPYRRRIVVSAERR